MVEKQKTMHREKPSFSRRAEDSKEARYVRALWYAVCGMRYAKYWREKSLTLDLDLQPHHGLSLPQNGDKKKNEERGRRGVRWGVILLTLGRNIWAWWQLMASIKRSTYSEFPNK